MAALAGTDGFASAPSSTYGSGASAAARGRPAFLGRPPPFGETSVQMAAATSSSSASSPSRVAEESRCTLTGTLRLAISRAHCSPAAFASGMSTLVIATTCGLAASFFE